MSQRQPPMPTQPPTVSGTGKGYRQFWRAESHGIRIILYGRHRRNVTARRRRQTDVKNASQLAAAAQHTTMAAAPPRHLDDIEFVDPPMHRAGPTPVPCAVTMVDRHVIIHARRR